jgi:tetratricopeptide (TPR) repeat protein
MFMRALKGKEKALGADHTSTLDAVHSLAILYTDQGKLLEAEEIYKRALRGYKKALGADHTSTLDTVHNLGVLYKAQGKLAEAEEMHLRALKGYEMALGANARTIPVLNTVTNLGVLYKDQGKLAEAEEMYHRALQGYDEVLGPDHTSTIGVARLLCSLYRRMAFRQRFKYRLSASYYCRHIGEAKRISCQRAFIDCISIRRQYPSSGSQVYGDLGRILMWNYDEDHAALAFEQQIELVNNEWLHFNIQCDGCRSSLNLETGRLICKNCLDCDLCLKCYKKYELDEIKIDGCQDHTFLASPREAWGSILRSTTSIDGETLAAWLERLTTSSHTYASAEGARESTKSGSYVDAPGRTYPSGSALRTQGTVRVGARLTRSIFAR